MLIHIFVSFSRMLRATPIHVLQIKAKIELPPLSNLDKFAMVFLILEYVFKRADSVVEMPPVRWRQNFFHLN
jgi:hypothetical protein